MKRFLVALCAIMFSASVMAATPSPRGRAPVATPAANATTAAANQRGTARAAVATPTTINARAARVPAVATPAVGVRAPVVAARAATTAAAAPTVTARAAMMQKVVQGGTNVTAAYSTAGVVDQACHDKFYGCMDSFCMISNDNGGRCQCNDRKADLDKVLTQITTLDNQTYQMATTGVERIQMGANADYVFQQQAEAEADALKPADDEETAAKSTTQQIAELWNTNVDSDSTQFDPFAVNDDANANPLDGLTGNKLYAGVLDICRPQMTGCEQWETMLETMYATTVQGDCKAYENDLNTRMQSSQQKLLTAQKAVRDAALDSFQTANKYDAGQCAVQFRTCMAETAGCGDDFTGCVGTAAATNAMGATARTVPIQGAMSQINIAATSYDALTAKRPMCDNVTKNCVAAVEKDPDAVWNIFLRDIAPTIKSAELVAENDTRMNCVGNISACFQKGCQDTFDPNDEDGSYDMCLTRPETMLSVCKIPLDACGIATDSASNAQKSPIWDFVVARMAAMRVDSCSTEVKSCLTSDDVCGKDFSNCIGLDTDTIIRMCPYDKLVGCQKVYGADNVTGDDVYNELTDMVQGLMLTIDNDALDQCQKAADAAMVKVCGSTDDCNSLAVDDGVGSRSLKYQVCQTTGSSFDYTKCLPGADSLTDDQLQQTPFTGVLDGIIYWGGIDYDDTGKLTTDDDYFASLGKPLTDMDDESSKRIRSELDGLQNSINMAISTIEADPTVQYCISGRQVQGMNNQTIGKIGENPNGGGRFPDLTKSMRMQIAAAALSVAKDNYNKKYDELNNKLQSDYVSVAQRIETAQRSEMGRLSCLNLAGMSTLPLSPTPPATMLGSIYASFTIVAIPFMATNNPKGSKSSTDDGRLTGSSDLNQWNYKETVTTTYNTETMVCHKTVVTQNCSQPKRPWFKKAYCKSWGEPVTTESDIQY